MSDEVERHIATVETFYRPIILGGRLQNGAKLWRQYEEARDAYRVYRSTCDIAGHYQREVLPLRQIITDEMQLRFSSMQVDVFALLVEARQRITALRAAIEAKREFWLAQSDLLTAVDGGGRSDGQQETRPSTTTLAAGGGP